MAVGDGIGYALILDGKVRRGARGNAGKVGHALLDPDGPLCECGRRGCLQASHSYVGLLSRWDATQEVQLATALIEQRPEAVSFVTDAGKTIGAHLAEWVTLTDPEVVILGGEAVDLGPDFIASMERALADGYYRDDPPRIVPDQSSFYWTAGAAAVAVQQIFDFESAPEAEQVGAAVSR